MRSFGKCRGGGRRSSERQAAPLIAVVTTLKEAHNAVLVNISQTGVRLRGDNLPDEGAELFVSVERIRSFGTVAWKDAGECGICFDGPLPAADVAAIRSGATKGGPLALQFQTAFDDWTQGLAR